MSRPPADIPWVLALCAAGIALGLVPAELAARWRAAVRDALRPGQAAVRMAAMQAPPLVRWLSVPPTGNEELADLRSQLEKAESRTRQLEVQVAVLGDELALEGTGAGHLRGERRPALLVPQLVDARILGEESAALWRSRKVVGAGSADGIVEAAIVLSDDRPLVDQGQDAHVSAGDAVYAGGCVVGKIAEAGRFSSSVLAITDAGYSGRARVARRTERGLVFGAEGTLVGEGRPLCRLRHVTEPVNAGDEVYTGGTDGLLPYPMFYGRVVRAEPEAGAAEWTIEVEPARTLGRTGRVRILRLGINAGRVLAD